MMQRSVVATLLIIAIWVAYDACFVLRDTELGLLTRLGSEPRAIVAPGLHWKLPFASTVTRVDSRLRFFESPPRPRTHPDGRSELESALVAHRVLDVSAYVRSFPDEARLEVALDALAHEELDSAEGAGSLRAELRSLGVDVVFVEPRSGEPAHTEREAALASMLAEQASASARERARTEVELAEMRASTASEAAVVLAAARHEALVLRAKADAEAAALYAAAYGKDPALAELLQSLELYERTIHEDDHLIVSTRSSPFRTFGVTRSRDASP